MYVAVYVRVQRCTGPRGERVGRFLSVIGYDRRKDLRSQCLAIAIRNNLSVIIGYDWFFSS